MHIDKQGNTEAESRLKAARRVSIGKPNDNIKTKERSARAERNLGREVTRGSTLQRVTIKTASTSCI